MGQGIPAIYKEIGINDRCDITVASIAVFKMQGRGVAGLGMVTPWAWPKLFTAAS